MYIHVYDVMCTPGAATVHAVIMCLSHDSECIHSLFGDRVQRSPITHRFSLSLESWGPFRKSHNSKFLYKKARNIFLDSYAL